MVLLDFKYMFNGNQGYKNPFVFGIFVCNKKKKKKRKLTRKSKDREGMSEISTE